MIDDRWPQAKLILLEALELESRERSSFLDRSCGDDAALRQDVERYLSSEEEVEGFLERPVVDLLAARPAPLREGQRLGAYELGERLGQGGMGEVYRARRADDVFEQVVAVKILKRGLDTAEILRRFRQERQILAQLEHPNIARILDGGTTGDGLPYLVMEYVEGQPIHRYCESHELSISDRLNLVRKVCTTVHYAHQHLVVHRDLKPDNILVTEDGTPKLLDFGIARILEVEDGTVPNPTVRELQIMTPAWASPEQLRGQRMTTATDVYTLGVLLYRLLTGRNPFRRDGRPTGELIREVLETKPEKPSEAVSQDSEGDPAGRRQLARRLQGDLDTIVAKALHKEPERRYASAAELEEDLRRHLEDEPVAARPDSLGYRCRRFIKRHPLPVGAAAAVLLLITAFTFALSAQLQRTEVERDRAESAFDGFISLLAAFDPTSQRQQTGDEAREVLRFVLEDRSHMDPQDYADLSNRAGLMLDRLGYHEEAEELLNKTLERRESLPRVVRQEVAETLNNLGLNALHRGDPQEGLRWIEKALQVHDSAGVDLPMSRSKMKNNLATAFERLGRYAEAESIYRELLDFRRIEAGPDSMSFAIVLNNLSQVLIRQGNWQEGQALSKEVVRLRRQKRGPDHLDVATALMNLAAAHGALGDPDAAVAAYEEALRIRQLHFGPENPAVGRAKAALGFALLGRRRSDDAARAASLLRNAVTAHRESRGADDRETLIMQRNLVAALLELGRHSEAETLGRETLAGVRASLSEGHWRIADAESVLGHCLVKLGRYGEAEPLLAGSLPRIRQGSGEDSRYTREAQARVEELRRLSGRPIVVKDS